MGVHVNKPDTCESTFQTYFVHIAIFQKVKKKKHTGLIYERRIIGRVRYDPRGDYVSVSGLSEDVRSPTCTKTHLQYIIVDLYLNAS